MIILSRHYLENLLFVQLKPWFGTETHDLKLTISSKYNDLEPPPPNLNGILACL